MKKIKGQYRQGDVFIQRIETIPEGATVKEPERPDMIILAHGEATGHTHAIESKLATQYAWQGDMLISVTKQASVDHQEHSSIPLAPGNYKVIRQVEYSPERIRRVAD